MPSFPFLFAFVELCIANRLEASRVRRMAGMFQRAADSAKADQFGVGHCMNAISKRGYIQIRALRHFFSLPAPRLHE